MSANSECLTSYTGCNSKTSSGCAARYREWASDDIISLPTCFWRQHAFFNLGEHANHLFDLEMPNEYNVSCTARDWCGRSYRYAWADDGVNLEIRTSLPGPLFTLDKTHLHLRVFTGSEWREWEDLQSGQRIDSHGAEAIDGGRIYYASSDRMPVLIICSQPLQRLGVITHRHFDFEFSESGARVMVVPLLNIDDVPRDAMTQALWLKIVEHPSLHIEESFELIDGAVRVSGRSDGSVIPLSPFLSLLGEKDGLVCNLSRGTNILTTWCGPYTVLDTNEYSYEIAAQWMFAKTAVGTPAAGDYSEIPEEMSYAGDATWEPGTAMDQLFSIRSWAQYVYNAPADKQQGLMQLLKLPSADEMREAVEIIDDHDGHGTWGRWRSMWAHNGDACYDIDWYNGFGLSGLARAAQSPLEDYATEARELSRACREQRHALFNYFVVFMDWMHHCGMTDPQGWMWNADCIHNGMEGIIAEAELRKLEGDHEGAAFAYYIAARTAVSLRASMEFYDWHQQLAACTTEKNFNYSYKRMVTWSTTRGVSDRDRAPVIGIQGLAGFNSVTWCTWATRNPYVLAGHNPAWSALLKHHWSRKDELLADWDANEPDRYRDWMAFYIGEDWQERRARGDQEARVQAAVFYSLAPEICFRYWTLGQDPAEIEARFATPLHLNEQIVLRSGCALIDAPVDWTGKH